MPGPEFRNGGQIPAHGNELKTPQDILAKSEVLETLNIIIEDNEYKFKVARTPKSKRSAKGAIQFWKSVKYHLESK